MTGAAELSLDGERVMAASMDAMAAVDGEQYVTVNQSFADLYGFARPNQLDGEPWDRRLAEHERSRFEREVLPTCRGGGRWRGTVTGRRRDGTTFSQALSVAPLDEGRLLWVCRETAPDPLPAGATGTRGLVETVDDGMYVLDENLEFSLVNDALCEMLGRSRDEFLGRSVSDVFSSEERCALADEVRDRVANRDFGTGIVEGTTALGDETVHLETRYRLYADSDGEFRGSVAIVRDVTERKERENELRRQRTLIQGILNTIPDVVFAYDDEGNHIVEDALLDEFAGYPKAELAEMELVDFLPEDDRPTVRDHVQRAFEDGETVSFETEIVTKDGRAIPHEYRAAPMELDGEVLGFAAAARDITERLKRERKLELQRDELETLNRINGLLLEVTQDLVESPTRDAIEQKVCDRLAESELYQFAWVGEPETNGDRILPRASAGVDEGYVESVTVTTTETETGRGPGGRAVRTGEVQVSQDVRTDPRFEPWRDAALDRDVQSAAAVPLLHGDATYGILAVYATRPLAFSRREQAGFETLGKAVGFAINAIENRKLLFADTILQLEFEISDLGLVFVRASERLGCELTVTGYVESESGDWSVYLAVDGAAPTAVRRVAMADPDVDRVRVVADEGDAGLLEFVMGGPALTEITEHGATLTSGHVEDGRGRFRVEAPRSADVRRLFERLQNTYPASTLVSQRELDRPVRKAVEMRQSMEDRLTERQRQALERAYHSGYFDWPRRSTAGDVADSMNVAETTFHYHLRNGLDTLLGALLGFEDR